jgi:hypothetical protein
MSANSLSPASGVSLRPVVVGEAILIPDPAPPSNVGTLVVQAEVNVDFIDIYELTILRSVMFKLIEWNSTL